MKMDFLYNPDNGMAFPWTQAMADGRTDLVAVTDAELQRIAKEGVSVNDILAARLEKAEAEVSIEVPIANDVAQNAPETAQDAFDAPKGVVAPLKTKPAVAPVTDVFGNEQRDYEKEFRGRAVPTDIDGVPNEDLIRFVKEVTGRDFGECPEGDENEIAAWYDLMRGKAKKLLARMVKSREKRAALKESLDGSND